MAIIDFRGHRAIGAPSEVALHRSQTLISGLFKQPLRLYAVLAPLRRAASMYSRKMTRRVAASATREIGAINTTLIASTEFVTPGPSDAEIAIASMIAGKA